MQQAKQAIWICPSCQQKNRVHTSKHNPTCGRCHTQLDLGTVQKLDEQTFESVLQKSDIPVLVDFWAPWCGPCRMIAPMLEQLARKYAGQLIVAKVNTDDEARIAQRFGIRALPTIALFSQGREVDRQMGALPLPQMERWLQSKLHF
ncbi:MAG: thioredoxin TrxC [Myxococcales bacterium]|nr:thioredoxin TrxC [Myxococcales bacterium]MCB9644795.1 thioredoxin TrxC [Myxococcales bacterium]